MRFSSSSSPAKTASANRMMTKRFQVTSISPSWNEPDIHDGLPTSRLVGPKIERTVCCRIRLTPQVASSVSSGRP